MIALHQSGRNRSPRYEFLIVKIVHEIIFFLHVLPFQSMDTHAPPSFPNLPTVKYPAAKTIRLECKATTTPLIWYKNGELLETNSGRVAARNNELVISNTVSGDSGIYQCESSRRLGSGRLIIQSSLGMPSPPVDVSCSSSSSKSIRISWKVRSEEQNINAFSIHYTPTGFGQHKFYNEMTWIRVVTCLT